MRRALAGLVLVACLAVGASVATAQEPPVTTGDPPRIEIIPRPNSGHEPVDAGDRGGGLQLALLVLVVAAVAGGAWHISRQVRRGRVGT